jgi:CRISPR system Cascade subunit CasB
MSGNGHLGSKAMTWWANAMCADRPAGRQLSARIRRASSSVEVLSEPKVFELADSLQIKSPIQITLITKALSYVKEHDKNTLATLLGRGSNMSDQRFRRLISTPYSDLDVAIRRSLAMTGGKANVAYLATDLLFWNERTQSRWCMDYHRSSFAEESHTEEDKVS